MDAEVVLFLRKPVPAAALQPALAESFGIPPDLPLVVGYPQGFALGISVPCSSEQFARRAAKRLASRLGTEVLLEPGGREAHWLLFRPEVPQPVEVEIIELRYGLDVA
ncbi:hypothetical protein [Noviherbaspirillum denitrificans]|uniref:Uncharacterized protein n=1 Tax=Noviherbaspirillum denitrificans TaxID=1968433 RepID=A0A254T7I6_9BURK|nr:hypothetical protein [Noviherbaspirillum denitrificans]OWW18616.1 hypothetical protein AYR66_03240 [Noviherbaspirillum denitrificans]